MHDWVVWCKSKKGAEEIRLFEHGEKESFFHCDYTKLVKEKKNRSKHNAQCGQSIRYRQATSQKNMPKCIELTQLIFKIKYINIV